METNKLLHSLEYLRPASLKIFASTFSTILERKLWAKILLGMTLGLILGSLISPFGFFAENLSPYVSQINDFLIWLALPAKFFLKTIQMVIIPLIVASVIRGLASAESSTQMKTLGLKFALFVFVTSLMSSALGIILSNILRPGQLLDLNLSVRSAAKMDGNTVFSSFDPEVLLNIIPINPIESIVQGEMIDVVIISIIAGIALLSIGVKQSNVVLDLLEVVQNICMKVIAWAMKIAPYAIFGMMTAVAANTGLEALQSMGLYLLTVFSGFLLVILFYTAVVFLTKRISPLSFLKKIMNPMLLAFTTSSSAATMPVSLKAAEEELGVSTSTANFLIPLGTTINMAGIAIWQTIAVMFLSQVYRVDLSLGQILFVVGTSLGSAIGSPGVPGVGMGILAVVLGKIGIPIEGISLILGVDRIVDMGCTVVNVVGDLTASVILDT